MEPRPEPWLRGPLAGVDASIMPVLHALMQAQEDLHLHTTGLRDSQVWERPSGITPLGFHLRHIAGSLDRLTTYLEGGSLSDEQLAFLRTEITPGSDLAELLHGADEAIARTSVVIRNLDTQTLGDARRVGRKELPTTVMGLAIHIAEHTQRHVGQVITLCAFLKASNGTRSPQEAAHRS